jgi:hypothetical protein
VVFRFAVRFLELRESPTVGLGQAAVGHEVQPLPEVGRSNPRCAKIERPDGVVLSFQIRRNNVEP